MPDLEISKLPEMQGPGLQASDPFAIADLSASETKRITAKALIQSGVALIDDGSIPYAKIDAPTVAIPDNSITTGMLQDGAVTDDKIANVDGSKIIDGTITGAELGAVTDRGLDQTGGKIGITNAVLAETHAGISWNAQGLVTGTAAVVPPEDLPLATVTTVGAVSVPADGGLEVSGTGGLSHQNNPGANSVANITYDDHGHILFVNDIEAGYLPVATTDLIGAVSVPATGGLLVSAPGALTLNDSGVTVGTYPKVTVDTYGRVTSGSVLAPSDIPNLDAGKILTGEFAPDRLADRSITEIKLTDYSTCYVQEGQPSGDSKIGQFWFTPSTSQLRVYNRGSGGDLWLSVGFGALQAQNLRWAGTFNATTGTMISLTDIGVSEGLTAGGPLPAPTNELSGIYFVCQEGGSNVNLLDVTGETFTEGDWLLCIDQAQGYTALNVSAGGGGGGGASKLNDLTDVNISILEAEQFLQYDPISGMWVNVSLISGGTY